MPMLFPAFGCAEVRDDVRAVAVDSDYPVVVAFQAIRDRQTETRR